jgi:hypothetical protein
MHASNSTSRAKMLSILVNVNPPENIGNIAELVDSTIATFLHAIRNTVHSTLGISPDALVFHRDVLNDISFCQISEPSKQNVQRSLMKISKDRIKNNDNFVIALMTKFYSSN